jgi:hypothetical protein
MRQMPALLAGKIGHFCGFEAQSPDVRSRWLGRERMTARPPSPRHAESLAVSEVKIRLHAADSPLIPD